MTSQQVAGTRPVVTRRESTRRLRLPGTAKRSGVVALSMVLLYAVWVFGSRLSEPYILPGPDAVWNAFSSALDRGVWWADVQATLGHAIVAFALILLIGLPLGMIIGRFRTAEDFMRVPLVFLQTVPTVVLIVIALIAVGATSTGVIAVTVAGGLTYFTLNVIQGTRSIDHDLVEMARAYGATERSIMRSVTLPSVVPYFLAGSRITLGVVWQITLFGEYLMGTKGIGFQISGAIKLLDMASVFAWGFTVVALTLLVEYGLFRPLEAYLTRHVKKG